METSATHSLNSFAPLALLVVQPTPFCNIDCSYCYLPDRSNKRRISLETVTALARFLRETPVADGPLSLVWHAGEPLVAPIDFYRRAFELLAEHSGPVTLQHHFQTNATLLSDAWCEFIKAWSVKIGVSIDGPREVHDARRVTRDGRGTFEQVLRGIETLRRHDVAFSVIAVVTPATLAAPDATLEFLGNLGATSIGFNIEETEGRHRRSLLQRADVRERVLEFYTKLARLQAQRPGLHVRELDGMRRHLKAPPGTSVFRANNRAGAIISVDIDGHFSTFSPELLGLHAAEYGDFAWGNVHRDRLTDLALSPAFQRAHADIALGIERCRETCDYFCVCGGGDPSNKLGEHGELSGTTTMACELHVKALADVVVSQLEHELGDDHAPVE